MPHEPEFSGDPKRPLRALPNSDLVAELKSRIVNRELKEALLFDLNTGRVYSDLELESRRFLGPDAVMKIVFPMADFDADSRAHQRVTDLLFDLPDSDFSALRSVVLAETEEGLRRMIVKLESLGFSNVRERLKAEVVSSDG
ncbi:hypothetical protein [Primorskyibacter sp. S87]|uniref:hypothetical protein n=1 Tax=Primorskyibacter sp. S87 TaxID=3415126 RepID=UPI003C7A0CC0